jgi:hypothetical protein
METIAQTAEEFKLEFIICPDCNGFASVENATTVFEPFSGIVLGYNLACEHCNGASFIRLLGTPPLFDLSSTYKTNRGE